MGDSSTSAATRSSSAAVRRAIAAPIERPQSAGWNGDVGIGSRGALGEGVEPGPDVAGLAAPE